MQVDSVLPPLARNRHASHLLRCLRGVSGDFVEADSSRMTLAFYCLSGLDALDLVRKMPQISDEERNQWISWIWQQEISGEFGTGFRPGPSMEVTNSESHKSATTYDQPHLIMTYTAILSLSILEDGLSRLDRPGIVTFLRSTQLPDGSFTPTPGWGESDVRLVYCAFVLCFLLDDWSHIDVEKAVDFVRRCRTYEGGFGQTPGQEAQGGTTYCSIAALNLVANIFGETMAPDEREETVRWLIQRQTGGFQGRTEKEQDACYSFWCGAALQILGAGDLVDADANAEFLNRCQFKFGGIAKIPEERPDPFHTYLSLASLSIYPPSKDIKSEEPASWVIGRLHTTINAQAKTAQWAIDSMRQRT